MNSQTTALESLHARLAAIAEIVRPEIEATTPRQALGKTEFGVQKVICAIKPDGWLYIQHADGQ